MSASELRAHDGGPVGGAVAVAPGPLVFLGDKSGGAHAVGCYSGGSAFVWLDGRTAPLRSKASNRCAGCARVAAFEAMTMLRQDAEENSAPGHVLTLTSRDAIGSGAYRAACAVFWRAFRRRWGRCEFCGFVEWTTGTAARSGGKRRLHSHWLVKGLDASPATITRATGSDPCVCHGSDCVECWTAAEWSKLTGAWIVQARELRSVGGVVGYLALHHDKMQQAPPAGWTGRRLRPSRGYFALDGRTRRERARLWLVEHRWDRDGLDDGGKLARAGLPAPRLVGALAEWEKGSREAIAQGPGRSFDSLPARVALDEQLCRPEAPTHATWEDATWEDAEHWRWRLAWRARATRSHRPASHHG